MSLHVLTNFKRNKTHNTGLHCVISEISIEKESKIYSNFLKVVKVMKLKILIQSSLVLLSQEICSGIVTEQKFERLTPCSNRHELLKQVETVSSPNTLHKCRRCCPFSKELL